MQIDITIIISLVTLAIAVVTVVAGTRKSNRLDGEALGEQKADLKHIKDKVDDVWANLRSIEGRLESVDRRLAAAEESTKSAHKRIDDLKGGKAC